MTARGSGRRDRVRASTLADVREAARHLLTTRGSAAVTVNAVARRIGMSGPALYHYFAGHDALVSAVTTDFLGELTAAMEAARDRHDAPGARLLAACRAMRAWALTHPAEFGWIFARPIPAATSERVVPDSARNRAARGFELVFLEQIEQVWALAPFPVARELDPAVAEQLRPHVDALGRDLPVEAVHVALSCWIRLYGLLCMEVLNQLDFAYSDVEPLYEETLRELSDRLGIDYTPPETGRGAPRSVEGGRRGPRPR